MNARKAPDRNIEETIAALDADLRAAKDDVDMTLIEAALGLTPAERLDAAYGFLRDLVQIRDRNAAPARS